MINDSAPDLARGLGGAAAPAALGLGAGVAVTRHAHRVPASPWWDERVGHSKLRRSDLPVGGAAALLTAAVKLTSPSRLPHQGVCLADRGLSTPLIGELNAHDDG